MARRSGGGGGRRGRNKQEDSEFVRLTGLWRPDRDKKHIGQGNMKLDDLLELVEKIEDKGGDGAFIYLFKNDYIDSENDPRYILTALPLEARDNDDDEPRRKRKGSKSRSRSKYEEDDIEDEEEYYEEDEDEDEEEEEEPVKKRQTKKSTGKRPGKSSGRSRQRIDNAEEPPF